MNRVWHLCLIVIACVLGLSGAWFALVPHTPFTLLFLFCSIGCGILLYGIYGFYALRVHARVGGQYGNEAFLRVYARLYAYGCVSVVVMGMSGMFQIPGFFLVFAYVVAVTSCLYVGISSVRMQYVHPSLPYKRNYRVYPPQVDFFVSCSERVSPWTGYVEVSERFQPANSQISLVQLNAQFPVSIEALPSEGVPIQVLRGEARRALQHTVEAFFAREVRGMRETHTIAIDLKQILHECGFREVYGTCIERAYSSHPVCTPDTCIA